MTKKDEISLREFLEGKLDRIALDVRTLNKKVDDNQRISTQEHNELAQKVANLDGKITGPFSIKNIAIGAVILVAILSGHAEVLIGLL